MPSVVKILATLVITYAFFPVVEHELLKDISYLGEDNFWVLTSFNVLVGLILGFLVRSIMGIFISAGTIITQQIGFAALSYFDPQSAQQEGPFEKLIQWTMLVIVLSSGALIPMFKGIVMTFSSIHVYDLAKLATSPVFFVELFKSIFLSALLLSSPLIFANILMMALLGVMTRIVPQMNIIMVSFIVNIALGLLVFSVTAEELFQVGFKIYTEKLGDWFQFVT